MGRKTTILLLPLWPVVDIWASFTFHIGAWFSPLLFYGLPAILLSLYMPKRIKKVLIVSLFIIPFMTIADYIAEKTGIWVWPLPHSIFPIKLFNYVSIEVLLWAFLHIYFVIMFYQYFFEKKFYKKLWDKRSESAFVLTSIIAVLFLIILFVSPAILNIPYWYTVFGIVLIIPIVIIEDFEFPTVFPKLLKTAMYFFYINFTYEITALKLGWWSFPSNQYIGRMYVFGVTFPFEEFFFWIALFTLAILSYYEFFFNREK